MVKNKRSAREKAPRETKKAAEERDYADDATVQEVVAEAKRISLDASAADINALSLYLRDLRQFDVLTTDEEQDLAKRAQNGDDLAMERLAIHNLRFVVTIAKQHANRGLPLEDLIQEGNSGLLKAVRRFQHDRGVKFISYAVHWIQQSIRASIARNQRALRLPLNRASQLAKVHKAIINLSEKFGRMPTTEEIATEVGLPSDIVRTLEDLRRTEVSFDDTQAGEDGMSAPLSDRIASEDRLEERVERVHQQETINGALSRLPLRDEKIVRLFFGLDGGRNHTLEEIGDLLGVTRERIRQLRDRALKRLREDVDLERLTEEVM